MLYFVKKGKIDTKDVKLFWNRWVHKFYRLKALITLEQVNTSVINDANESYGEHTVYFSGD